MNSAIPFFDRSVFFRRLNLVGVLLISTLTFLVGQNNDQSLLLDENGQAELNTSLFDDCFQSTICIPSRAIGDDHALWLSNNSFPGSSTDFLFESGAQFVQNPDGTATITGTLYNTSNATDKWQVELYLSDKMNWSQWSALGRSYKDEAGLTGTNYLDWDYYVEDPNQVSQLVGLEGNSGKTVPITHMPSNFTYGFQVGTAANNKNADFGLSGWFNYSLDGTNYYQGDFNLNLDCIDRETTTVANKTNFNCSNLGQNTVTITSTDQFGNTCTEDIIVTVTDNVPPVIDENAVHTLTLELDENGTASLEATDLYDNGNSEEQSCTASKFGGSGSHAVWLSKYNSSNENVRFFFDENGGFLQQFSDGTAKVSGIVVNQGNANDRWEVSLNLIDKKNWNEWSALGRSWKGRSTNVVQNYLDWTFYIMDTNPSNPSQLVGLGDNAGKTKTLTHAPANYNYGFQIGQAANDKDGDYGMSGWFTYQNDQGSTVQGDFNLDLTNCSSGSCGTETVTVSKEDFDCNDVGDQTVTITVTDQSGNASTTTTTVTIIENTPPVITPTDISVNLDANGQATITPGQVYASITDNCSVTDIQVTPLEFDCDDLGENTVTITATDANGNVTTATATVTVKDVTPPTVVTKNISIGLNSQGWVEITPEQVIQFNCNGGGGVSVPEPVPGSGSSMAFTASNCTSDNCSIASYTVSKTRFTCNESGQNTVTVTVVDGSGNVTTATAVVTVVDTTKPTVKAKNVTIELDENGIATLSPDDINNGSSDSCGSLTLTVSKSTFNCDDIGSQPVTLIGTDNGGNTKTTTAVVTVVDNAAPVVVTQNLSLNLDANGEVSIEARDLLVICDDAVIDIDDGGGDNDDGDDTDEFVPGSGNAAGSSDFFTQADPTCTKDNCTITSIVADKVSFNCDDIGENIVTVTVYDAEGNLTQATATVTINDIIPPVAIAIPTLTVDLDENGQAAITVNDIDQGSSDNCNITTTIDKDTFDCTDIDNNPQTVTLTVTDQGGNTAVATTLVTVRDAINPTVITQNVTVTLDENGQATITTTDIDNGSADNCGIQTITLDNDTFDCTQVGQNTVNLTVTDASGNSVSAPATVTVIENTPPVITPTDISVNLDANGQATITPGQVYASITDNCSVTDIQVTPLEFDCDDLGENTVTITATDANGNVATTTATVTVKDVTPPTVVTKNISIGLNSQGWVEITPEQVIQFNCNGGGGVSVPEPVPGSGSSMAFTASNCTSDNCSIASYTVSKTRFTCNESGQNTVTVTVVDGSGNVTTATAVVTVVDTTKPTVKAKNVTIELDENGIATLSPDDINNGSSDSCGSLTLTVSKSTFNCDDIGSQPVTLIGTDNGGNTKTATAVVTVVDNAAPVVVTQNLSLNLDANGEVSIEARDLLVICDDAVIDIDDGGGDNDDGDDTDEFVPGSGNAASSSDFFTQADPTCTKDNCTITSIVADKVSFNCDDIGENIVTVTVYDAEGNLTQATATVTINDIIPPVAIAIPTLTVDLDENGQAAITVNDIDQGSSDNCNITTTIDKDTFDCTDIDNNPQTVTLTVTDQGGNTAVATTLVTVRDAINPTVITQNVTVTLDENGQATITTTDIDNGSADNCGIQTITLDNDTFDCTQVGQNTVNLTVTDASGNSVSAPATVTVIENTPPVITPTDISVNLDANGQATITPGQVYASITDNCSVTDIQVTPLEFDCDDLGENTVTITATDANGNVATTTATVTVKDVTPPTVVTKNISIGLNSQGWVEITPEQVIQFNCNGGGGVSVPEPVPGSGSSMAFTASNCTSDNCSIASYTVSKTRFTCNESGQNTVTVTVVDGSGNVTTATAVVTVVDTTKPTVKAKNVTIELDENGIATLSPDDINNGSSDSCGSLTLTVSKSTFNCDDIGSQPVTLIGTDNGGNTKTATAVVTVVDNAAPVVVTQNLSLNLDANGEVSIEARDLLVICDDAVIDIDDGGGDNDDGDDTDEFVPGSGNAASSSDFFTQADPTCTKDNCTITSIVADKVSFNCDDIGENIVTVTVYDAEGNLTQATATVTINDIIPPVAIAIPTLTVDLDENGQAAITVNDIDQGSSDNCNITTTIDKDTFDCTDIDNNPQTVTLTVTDQGGNTAVATTLVTVRDAINPTVITQNVTVTLDENGQATITTTDIDNGSANNCGIQTITLDNDTFDCTQVGQNTVNLTVTDASGNSVSAPATVTVIENTPPVITPTDISVNLDANGQATITPGQVYASITDNCSVTDIQVTPLEFDCDDLGENTVTITATDANGNVTTATATVTVKDVTPPTVVTKNISVELDASGNASITIADIDNGSSDNCDITLSLDKLSFDCSNVGANTVTLTGTDGSGNTATATAVVTVIDNSTPVLNPSDVTLTLDENGNASLDLSDALGAGTYTDCEVTAYAGGNNHAIALSRYYPNNNSFIGFVFDANGGSLVQHADGTATVSGIIVNKSDANDKWQVEATLSNERNWTEWSALGRSWKGNAGNVGNNYLDWSYYEIDNTSKLVGLGNNSGQTITLTHAPGNYKYGFQVGQGANDKNANKGASGWFTYTNYNGDQVQGDFNLDIVSCSTLTDGGNCGPAEVTASQVDFDCSNLGTNTVTLTATAANGNTTSEDITVTIVDDMAPVVKAQDITVSLDENGQASITVAQIDNGSYDNCDLTLNLDQLTFDCSDLGTNTVTLSGVDGSNNTASATATVTVTDNIAPVINITDISVSLDASGNATITSSQVASATDNCSTPTLEISQTAFDCNNIGQNTVTITATDGAGNTSTSTAVVTITETTAPVVNTQNLTVTLDANGQATITAGQIDNGSTDNCGIDTIELDKTTFDCTNLGDNIVTLTVTDVNGNSSSADATVVVKDEIAPAIIANDITVNLDENGLATITEAQVYTSITDNCGVTEITVGPLLFDCSNLGENTVTIQAADAAGNISTTTATVTVIDNTAPVINTTDISVALDANGNATITSSQVASATDNCSTPTLEISQTAFDCNNIGQNTVTITATDAAGNTSTSTAVVTITETTAPVVNTQSMTVTLNANGQATITAGQIDNGSTDNCGIDTIELDKTTFNCTNLGDNIVTLTVTDVNGNSSSANATVVVKDEIAPAIIANDITVNLDENGQAIITQEQVYTSITDNCGVTEITVGPLLFDCSNLGENTVTIQAADAAGNISTTTATVTVIDNTAPTVLTKNVSVELGSNGSVSITIADIDNGSSDNCDLTLSLDKLSFDCSNVGANTVTLTGTDASGNTATATAVVTVIDNSTPVLNPSDVTLTLDENGNASLDLSDALGAGTYTDCEVTAYAGGNNHAIALSRYYPNNNSFIGFVFDANGGSLVQHADGTATVSGIIVNKSDANDKWQVEATLSNERNWTEWSALGRSWKGNAGNVGNNYLDWSYYEIDNTSKLVGLGNNSGQTITLTHAPGNYKYGFQVGQGANDKNGNKGASGWFTYSNYNGDQVQGDFNLDIVSCSTFVSSGSCGDAEVTASQVDFDCSNLGTNTVTLTATAANGNTTSEDITVTIVDDTAPVVKAQDITVTLDENGQASITVAQIDNGSYDNCDLTLNLDQLTFDCSDLGTNTVTLSGVDGSNNTASATATVTVTDNIAPAINTTDISVSLDASGNATITSSQVASATDNCGTPTLEISQTVFDCNNIGQNTVTITATDGAGNQSQSVVTVTVVDSTAPIAKAKDLTVYLNKRGRARITATKADNGSFDNCGIAHKAVSSTLFTCDDLGVNEVTLTVTDTNGNSSTTHFNVTVIDSRAPEFWDVPENIVYHETDDSCGEVIHWTAPVVTDNCDVTLTSSHQSGDTFPVGTTTVTYSAVDLAGNTAEASFTVTVVAKPISITFAGNYELNCADGTNGSIDASIDGGCAPYSFSWSNGSSSEDLNALTTGTYTLTVTDANGNTADKTVSITAPDAIEVTGIVTPEYPVATNGDQHTIYLGYGEQSVTLTANATGGSGNYTYEWYPENAISCSSDNSVEVAPRQTTTYTVVVTDENGCSTTEDFIIKVVDVRCDTIPGEPGGGGDNSEPCECNGKMQDFTVSYQGPSGVTVYALNKKKNTIIGTYRNVRNGDEITVSGFDHKGRLESKTYLVVSNSYYEVHTSCSVDIIGDKIGPFTVTSYTDGEGNFCNRTPDTNNTNPGTPNNSTNLSNHRGGYDFGNYGSNDDDDDDRDDDDDDRDDDDDDGDDDDDDDDNGGGTPSDCQCEGRMENFTFTYTGVSGVTIKAYNKKFNTVLGHYTNVQNGDEITIEGYDRHGRLDSKTYLRLGSSYYEIHTSCSVNILGESFGPFTIISYTDGEGSYCAIDNDGGDNGGGNGDDDDDDNGGNGNGSSEQSCEASGAEGGGHALWLSGYTSSGSAQFFFDNNSGSFMTLENGKAKLTGLVSNRIDPDDQWRIEFYFSDKMSWAEWSAEGRSYKDEAGVAGDNYLNWSYYIMDTSQPSKIVGLGDNAGVEKTLYHKPSDFYLGFQLGNAANNKNTNYGISGWFSYKNYRGQWVQGDINIDLSNCQSGDGGGCNTNTVDWSGNIGMCLNGQSICVEQEDVNYYFGLGATLGTCDSSQAESNGGVSNGTPNDRLNLAESTPRVDINAFPNPTRGIAEITFSVIDAGPVTLAVYNAQGQVVGNLFKGEAEANTEYSVTFDGSGTTEGVYMIRLRTAGYLETKKLIIQR